MTKDIFYASESFGLTLIVGYVWGVTSATWICFKSFCHLGWLFKDKQYGLGLIVLNTFFVSMFVIYIKPYRFLFF